MRRRRTSAIYLLAVLLSACAHLRTSAPGALWLRAEESTLNHSTIITINREGVLHRHSEDLFPHPTDEKEFRLSIEQLTAIRAALSKSEFESLTDEQAWPGNIVTDEPIFTIEVREASRTHAVRTLGVNREVSTPGLERFRTVWRSIPSTSSSPEP